MLGRLPGDFLDLKEASRPFLFWSHAAGSAFEEQGAYGLHEPVRKGAHRALGTPPLCGCKSSLTSILCFTALRYCIKGP